MAQFKLIKPNTKIPFIKNHKPFLWGLLLLGLASILLSFFYSPNWGTSFRGGTAITMHFSQPVGIDEVRTAFVDDPRFESVSVQVLGAEEDYRYVVRTRTTTTLGCDKLAKVKAALPAALQGGLDIGQWPACDPTNEDGIRGDFFVTFLQTDRTTGQSRPFVPENAVLSSAFESVGLKALVSYENKMQRFLVKPLGIQAEALDLLKNAFGDRFDAQNGLDEIVTVGADVGEKFRVDAIVSILIALGLMFLYIVLRFDSRYAPAAVISLATTTFIAFGFVVVMQLEITLETVAAMLSLVGYGINDTIVNFDRIRENLVVAEPNAKLADIVNRSINECLSRTIMTSLTTIIAIAPMAILATGATQDFALIMTVGIIFATINSIFVSCPMMLKADAWFEKRRKRQEALQDFEEELGAEA